MSAQASIRVARLDLKVERRDLAPAFRNDFEDALRTAGMPRLPTGARLVIRRLKLGRIPAGVSRQALSRHIDARLSAAAYHLALPEAPPPETAEAVLVPDLATGAAIALDAVATGRPLPWYIRDVFPELPETPASDAAALILERLAVEAGPQTPGRLADDPHGGRRLLRALATLSEARIRAFLSHFGAGGRREALGEARRGATPPIGFASAPTPAPPAARAALVEALLRHAGPTARRSLTPALGDLPDSPLALRLLAAWLAAAHVGLPAASAAMARIGVVLNEAAEPGERAPRGQRSSPPAAFARRRQTPPEQAADGATKGHADPAPRQDVATGAPAGSRASTGHPALEGAFSDHAGLWLLLPALRFLGLEAAEAATGLSLGHGILSAFADRLGLHEADPARTGLAGACDFEPMAPGAWAPRLDVLRIVGGGKLHVRRMAAGKAAIFLRDGHGLVCIAGPRDIRAFRTQGFALRAASGPVTDLDSSLRRGLMLAAQRLVSRTTGKGWRRLAARRGRIVSTATHLDIEYDGRDVDPAVRIAGLDLDPGWTPGLGRVVTFHYDYSRVRDFSGSGGAT